MMIYLLSSANVPVVPVGLGFSFALLWFGGRKIGRKLFQSSRPSTLGGEFWTNPSPAEDVQSLQNRSGKCVEEPRTPHGSHYAKPFLLLFLLVCLVLFWRKRRKTVEERMKKTNPSYHFLVHSLSEEFVRSWKIWSTRLGCSWQRRCFRGKGYGKAWPLALYRVFHEFS